MFKFFDFVISMAEAIVNFILNFFKMMGYLIAFIARGFSYVVSTLAYLPPWVLPFCLAVVSFSVILFILKR